MNGCKTSIKRTRQARLISDDINTISHVNENPRLLRGGAFNDPPALVRSAYRNWDAPAYRIANLRFPPLQDLPLSNFTPLPLPPCFLMYVMTRLYS